jgi:hypothetical protein
MMTMALKVFPPRQTDPFVSSFPFLLRYTNFLAYSNRAKDSLSSRIHSEWFCSHRRNVLRKGWNEHNVETERSGAVSSSPLRHKNHKLKVSVVVKTDDEIRNSGVKSAIDHGMSALPMLARKSFESSRAADQQISDEKPPTSNQKHRTGGGRTRLRSQGSRQIFCQVGFTRTVSMIPIRMP